MAEVRTLTVHGTLPRAPEPPLTSALCAYVAWYLERQVFAPSAVTFTGDDGAVVGEVEVSTVELARAAASVRAQLQEGAHARGWLGGRERLVLLGRGDGATRTVRLSRGETEVVAARGDLLLDAVAAMWRDHGGKVGTALARLDPLVAATFSALTAGLADDGPAGSPLPFEAAAILRELVPDVAAEVLALADGVDGSLIWRGPRPDLERAPIDRALAWLGALGDHGDGFFVLARPGRIQLWSRRDGRTAQLDELFDPLRPAAAIERARFAWRHRATFVDGLQLAPGTLGAINRRRGH